MDTFLSLIVIGIAISCLFRWYSSQGQGGSSGFPDFPTQLYGRTLTNVHLYECRPNGAQRSMTMSYDSTDRLSAQQIAAYDALDADQRRSVYPDQRPRRSGLPRGDRPDQGDTGYVDVGEYLDDAEVDELRRRWHIPDPKADESDDY
jgi:hypothetical protein